MAAGGVVALPRQIADKGFRWVAEGRQNGIARQEAALGIDRAARENIRDQRARNPFLFQDVIGGVDLLCQRGHARDAGKIAVGFQHHGDNVDLFPFRDIDVRKGGKPFF